MAIWTARRLDRDFWGEGVFSEKVPIDVNRDGFSSCSVSKSDSQLSDSWMALGCGSTSDSSSDDIIGAVVCSSHPKSSREKSHTCSILKVDNGRRKEERLPSWCISLTSWSFASPSAMPFNPVEVRNSGCFVQVSMKQGIPSPHSQSRTAFT